MVVCAPVLQCSQYWNGTTFPTVSERHPVQAKQAVSKTNVLFLQTITCTVVTFCCLICHSGMTQLATWMDSLNTMFCLAVPAQTMGRQTQRHNGMQSSSMLRSQAEPISPMQQQKAQTMPTSTGHKIRLTHLGPGQTTTMNNISTQ